MARTSRKGGVQKAAATPVERTWNVAIYVRLSREDSGRKGADTIDTQVELVSAYITQRQDLALTGTFIDNGVSGKDFERQGWSRLMDDIRVGKIDCIVVKDLSRFSRNYIETIEFLEKIFPFMGVRFISVNDGYDSENSDGHDGLIVALKSLMNDQHLRDISRKICSSVKARRERGEYTGSQAPFGYKKMDSNKGKLEPNPETASIIQQIFEWRAEGMGRLAICKRLDENGIPTPTEYLRRKYDIFNNSDFFKATIWREIVIKGILRNPVYIGTLQQGKHNQRLYEHKPCTNVPPEEWVITENAHEPIISQELWDAVQAVETSAQLAHANSAKRHDRPENILKGYTICGVCGSKMSRNYSRKVHPSGKIWETYYYICPIARQHPADKSFRSIRAQVVYDAVFTLVSQRLRFAENLGAIIEERTKQQGNPRAELDIRISQISRELEKNNQRISKLYEDYVDNLLNEHEYVRMKSQYERRAETYRQRLDDLSRKLSTIADVSENHWFKAAKMFQTPAELTREMLEAMVDRIEIFSPEHIDIVWKFGDDFALLETCANEEEAA